MKTNQRIALLALCLASNAPAQTFSAVGNMSTPRVNHTATLLQNGKVLIAGGAAAGAPSAELYDPSTRTFIPTGAMKVPRILHTATLLNDGRVLFAGGLDYAGNGLSTAELYDPVTGSFTATGNLAGAQWEQTATLLPNGKVLIAGTATQAELYDPAIGQFRLTGAYADGPNIAYCDNQCSSTSPVLPNGNVLVAFSYAAELYDYSTETFSKTGAPDDQWFTATSLMNGLVLFTGSWFGFPSVDIYNSFTHRFVDGTNLLNQPCAGVNYQSLTLLFDGTALVAGGEASNCPKSFFASTSAAQLYDPLTGTFSATANMISDRRSHTATLLNDGSILIAGGSHFDFNGNSPAVTLSSAELYLPHSGPLQLKFSAQPVGGTQGAAIPPVVVELQDVTGKLVTGFTDRAVSLTSNPAGVSMSAMSFNGIATFNGLSFNAPGTYTLTAASADLASVTSSTVNIGNPSYTISGQVTLNGSALNGVAVALSESESSSTVTNGSGGYSFSGLVQGGSFTVTPTLTGYTFTPPLQTFGNLGGNQIANFTATPAANFAVVSGQVTVSGVPLSGVTINVNGSQTISTTTSVSGMYDVALPAGGTYTISASLPGYSFSAPAGFNNLSGNQTANLTGIGVSGMEFYAVSPCRLVDTRVASFQSGFGPPSMSAGNIRTFPIPANTTCGIPATAAAYSLNITAVTHGYLGVLSIWPAGEAMPNVSTLNSYSTNGTAVANAAVVAAGTAGAVSLYTSDATDLVIDINGYFASPAVSGLEFYPVTPCRLVDTRISAFPSGFGSPSLAAGSTRTFVVPADAACAIPSTAAAYSLNVTAVPQKTLGVLSIWPAGRALPNVSTLNVYTPGTVVANAAIVPAGSGGAISTYVSDATDLVIDIDGYFAPPSANGLKFYPATPCRVADTRGAGFAGPFGQPSMTAGTQRSFPVPASSCGIPSNAGAYSLNFTAVPRAPQLGIFTTWPTGSAQPNVSTMNSYNGSVVANAAIVGAGAAGAISIYVTDSSDVLFDINGYFAQ